MMCARRPKPSGPTQAGFTLTELMIGMTIFALVGAAIASVFASTANTFGYQTRMTEAQTDLASAMALVQDDLRHLGYVTDNMNQSVFQQLTTGTAADTIQFVGDVNSNNVSDRITYALTTGTLMRTQDVWNGSNGWAAGTAYPVAANITNFTLQLYTVDPCTAVISSQTAAQVLATGTTSYISVKMTGTSAYKGQTLSRTLSSDVAERQANVHPICS